MRIFKSQEFPILLYLHFNSIQEKNAPVSFIYLNFFLSNDSEEWSFKSRLFLFLSPRIEFSWSHYLPSPHKQTENNLAYTAKLFGNKMPSGTTELVTDICLHCKWLQKFMLQWRWSLNLCIFLASPSPSGCQLLSTLFITAQRKGGGEVCL